MVWMICLSRQAWASVPFYLSRVARMSPVSEKGRILLGSVRSYLFRVATMSPVSTLGGFCLSSTIWSRGLQESQRSWNFPGETSLLRSEENIF